MEVSLNVARFGKDAKELAISRHRLSKYLFLRRHGASLTPYRELIEDA
jgi:hypothetical protein